MVNNTAIGDGPDIFLGRPLGLSPQVDILGLCVRLGDGTHASSSHSAPACLPLSSSRIHHDGAWTSMSCLERDMCAFHALSTYEQAKNADCSPLANDSESPAYGVACTCADGSAAAYDDSTDEQTTLAPYGLSPVAELLNEPTPYCRDNINALFGETTRPTDIHEIDLFKGGPAEQRNINVPNARQLKNKRCTCFCFGGGNQL